MRQAGGIRRVLSDDDRAYSLDDIGTYLGVTDIEFTVLEPAELRSRVETIADRFHRAAQRQTRATSSEPLVGWSRARWGAKPGARDAGRQPHDLMLATANDRVRLAGWRI